MAVETAADRAAFFESDEFAVAADYRPAHGAPILGVTLVFDQPIEPGEIPGLSSIIGKARRALLRRDEVATVKRGDRLIVTLAGVEETLTIEDRQIDDTGEIWALELK